MYQADVFYVLNLRMGWLRKGKLYHKEVDKF